MRPEDMAGAKFSDCGKYRYGLWRRWGWGSQVLWIMLNPSTADAHTDDPTIRRCAGFTKAWGGLGFTVVNLFALRTPYPQFLMDSPDPIGPDNNAELQAAIQGDWSYMVAAWGSATALKGHHLADREHWIRGADKLYRLKCLGTTKAGHPRHPLYVPKTKALERWNP